MNEKKEIDRNSRNNKHKQHIKRLFRRTLFERLFCFKKELMVAKAAVSELAKVSRGIIFEETHDLNIYQHVLNRT